MLPSVPIILNNPSKVTKYFSLLLDGKQTCSLCSRDRISQNLKYGILPNLYPPNFPAIQYYAGIVSGIIGESTELA